MYDGSKASSNLHFTLQNYLKYLVMNVLECTMFSRIICSRVLESIVIAGGKIPLKRLLESSDESISFWPVS
jgi:hypothetical protein